MSFSLSISGHISGEQATAESPNDAASKEERIREAAKAFVAFCRDLADPSLTVNGSFQHSGGIDGSTFGSESDPAKGVEIVESGTQGSPA